MSDFFVNWLSMALGGADLSGVNFDEPMQLSERQINNLLLRREEALEIASDYRTSQTRMYAQARARDLKNEIDAFTSAQRLQLDLENARMADATERLKIATQAEVDAMKLQQDLRDSMVADVAYLQRSDIGRHTDQGALSVFFGEAITGAEEGLRVPPAKQYASALYLIQEAGGTVDENGKVVFPAGQGPAPSSTLMRRMQEYVDAAAVHRARINGQIENAQTVASRAREAQAALSDEASDGRAQDDAFNALTAAGTQLRASVALTPGTVQEYRSAQQELVEGDEMLARLDDQVRKVDKYLEQDESLETKFKRAVSNPAFQRWAASYGYDIGRVTEDGKLIQGRDTTRAILLYGYQDRMGARAPLQRKQSGRTLLVERPGVPGTKTEVAEFAVGDQTMRVWKLTQPDGTAVYVDTGENDGDARVIPADEMPPEALAALSFADATPEGEAAAYLEGQGLLRPATSGEMVEYRELGLRPEDLRDGVIRVVNPQTGEVERLPASTPFEVIGERERENIEDVREERLAARAARQYQREEGIEDLDGSAAQRRALARRNEAQAAAERTQTEFEGEVEARRAKLEGEIEGLEQTLQAPGLSDDAKKKITRAIEVRRAQAVSLELTPDDRRRQQAARTAEDRLEARTQELGDVGKTPRQLSKQARAAAVVDDLGEEIAASIEGRPAPVTERWREEMDRLRGRTDRITEKVQQQGGKVTGVQALRLQNLAKRYGLIDDYVNPAARPEVPEGQRLATPIISSGLDAAGAGDLEEPQGIGRLPRVEIPAKHTPPTRTDRVFTPVTVDGADAEEVDGEDGDEVDQAAAARAAAIEQMRKRRKKPTDSEDETP